MQLEHSDSVMKTESLLKQMKQEHRIRKMLLAGSGAVGKTSLLHMLKQGTLADTSNGYRRTLFLNIESLGFSNGVTGTKAGSFQVIDIAGQLDQAVHPFRDAGRLAFGGTDLILLVFSSDSLQSLMDLQQWLGLIEDGLSTYPSDTPPQFVLIRNKIDLPDSFDAELVDMVLKNTPQVQAYFETSCITGQGIDTLKQWIEEHFMKEAKMVAETE